MSELPERIWLDAEMQPWRVWTIEMTQLPSYTRTDIADAAHRAGYEAARDDALAMGVGLLNYDAFMRKDKP